MSWDDLDLLPLQMMGCFFISGETVTFPRMTVLHELCFCPEITATAYFPNMSVYRMYILLVFVGGPS